MYTILRVENLTSEELAVLEARFKNLLPSSMESAFWGKDKRLRVNNTYVLSDKYFWTDCQSDIIELIEILSSALTYANNLGAHFTIDPAIFSIEYNDQKTIEFVCSSNLQKLLSQYNIHLVLSIYPVEWKCAELGDVFPSPVVPRPMNCILHINNLDTEEMFDKFVEMTYHTDVACPTSSVDTFFNRHNRTLSLSNDIGWCESHRKIIEKLHVILPALSYASKQGASFSIDIPLDMNEYRQYNLTCFHFSNEFVQLFPDLNTEINVTIKMNNMCN